MKDREPKVDAFINKATQWQAEMSALRAIILECGLTEELKWYQPVYTYQDSNVLIIGAFKEYCSLSFFKGALLTDPNGVLSKPGENTQSAKLIRFTSVDQIKKLKPVIKAFIKEAIANEKAGKKVTFKKITEHSMPEELHAAFKVDPPFKKAFQALTPGRQRAYLLHFSGAKQSSTRISRIEKCRPQIMQGKGMNE